MSKYGSHNFALSWAGTDMTAHIQSINGFDVEAPTEDAKPFGVQWDAVLPTGQKKASDIEVEGLYDDAAGGPSAVFLAALPSGPTTAPSAVVLTWGGSKTSSFNAYLVKFTRIATRNAITRYRATIRPTGTVTEA